MRPGTVLVFKDFKFEDESTRDKLAIVLNKPKDDEPYLICLTTTQPHRKKAILGCHSKDNYFYIDSDQTSFIENTWVVLAKYMTIRLNKYYLVNFEMQFIRDSYWSHPYGTP
ncbi:hypothetical protein GF406_04545 [candidate division KSB1 bacterium]|nr:hypothetical protein [candidate division KSB1 bacterium]